MEKFNTGAVGTKLEIMGVIRASNRLRRGLLQALVCYTNYVCEVLFSYMGFETLREAL